MYSNGEHTGYSAAEIRRYLNGQMDRAEMYALEKQAAEDPMLADAIEGYLGLSSEAAASDLRWLREKLDAVSEPAKVVPLRPKPKFNWWKPAIAAGFAGILIFAAAQLFNTERKNKEAVAGNIETEKTQPATVNAATEAAKPSADTTQLLTTVKGNNINSGSTVFINPDSLRAYYYTTQPAEAAKSGLEAMHDGVEAEKTVAPGTFKWMNADSAAVARTEERKEVLQKPQPAAPPANDEASRRAAESAPVTTQGNSAGENYSGVVVDRSRNTNSAAYNNRAENITLQEAKKKGVFNKVEQRADNDAGRYKLVQLDNSFNYRVVDKKGSAIPYANIAIPADRISTYSRTDGSFGLRSADSTLRISIKAAGYEPQTLVLKNNIQTANIVLNEDLLARDNNLVIVGDQKNFALRKQAEKDKAAANNEPEPLDGWAVYDSYLTNNINNNNTVKGDVELSFEVNKKGEISNLTVEKSLGAKEDEEAKRLVTQGPKWKSKKKKGKGRVIITF